VSAELAPRRTAAAAVLADYQREAATAGVAGRAMWGARLADTLGYLRDARIRRVTLIDARELAALRRRAAAVGNVAATAWQAGRESALRELGVPAGPPGERRLRLVREELPTGGRR
jgi:hypothetical protein